MPKEPKLARLKIKFKGGKQEKVVSSCFVHDVGDNYNVNFCCIIDACNSTVVKSVLIFVNPVWITVTVFNFTTNNDNHSNVSVKTTRQVKTVIKIKLL